MCVLLLLHGVFYQCQLGQVGDSVVQVFYTFTDFLSTWSIDYWKNGVESSNYNCIYDYFSMQFYQLCFMYFKALLLGVYIFMPLMFMFPMLSI